MGQSFSINENLFNKIKIQYLALGLIDVREARTTVGGTAEFFKLSEKGKNYLIQNSVEKRQSNCFSYILRWRTNLSQ
jgi:hypothetical protein